MLAAGAEHAICVIRRENLLESKRTSRKSNHAEPAKAPEVLLWGSNASGQLGFQPDEQDQAFDADSAQLDQRDDIVVFVVQVRNAADPVHLALPTSFLALVGPHWHVKAVACGG